VCITALQVPKGSAAPPTRPKTRGEERKEDDDDEDARCGASLEGALLRLVFVRKWHLRILFQYSNAAAAPRGSDDDAVAPEAPEDDTFLDAFAEAFVEIWKHHPQIRQGMINERSKALGLHPPYRGVKPHWSLHFP